MTEKALSANDTLLIHLVEGSPDDAPSAREFIRLESRHPWLELVIINGEPIYGDPKMIQTFFDIQQLESLDICGVEKSIHFNSQNVVRVEL